MPALRPAPTGGFADPGEDPRGGLLARRNRLARAGRAGQHPPLPHSQGLGSARAGQKGGDAARGGRSLWLPLALEPGDLGLRRHRRRGPFDLPLARRDLSQADGLSRLRPIFYPGTRGAPAQGRATPTHRSAKPKFQLARPATGEPSCGLCSPRLHRATSGSAHAATPHQLGAGDRRPGGHPHRPGPEESGAGRGLTPRYPGRAGDERPGEDPGGLEARSSRRWPS